MRMFENQLPAYRAIGYVRDDGPIDPPEAEQLTVRFDAGALPRFEEVVRPETDEGAARAAASRGGARVLCDHGRTGSKPIRPHHVPAVRAGSISEALDC